MVDPAVPWFSRDLTDLVQPMIPGRVYVVLAPTGTGKTLFGLNLVAHLLEEPALRLTVAATEETPRYLDLLACRAASVSYADYFYNRLPIVASERITDWRARYAAADRLHVLTERQPTLHDLVAALDPANLPHVLVIDHLHGLHHGTQRLPNFLDEAMAFLPALASSLNLVILLLAQVHRPQSRDPLYAYRIPTTTSGLGSSKIEQNADVILGLSRKLRDEIPKDAMRRLASGFLNRGESVRDYEQPGTARVTVLKHRMDDAASRRSILLTVTGGKMQDRLALEGTTNSPWPTPREPGED